MVRLPRTQHVEQERPAEWLVALQDDGGFAWLLEDSGNIAVAAHRLAIATCRTRSLPTALPTLRELQTAARTLASACGVAAPSAAYLLQSCELAGLDVIEPMERTPATPRLPFTVDTDAPAYAY